MTSRQMDRAIAEQVMGLKLEADPSHYASSMTDTCTLIDHLHVHKNVLVSLKQVRPGNVHHMEWMCEIFSGDGSLTLGTEFAATMQEATCRAALRVFGSKPPGREAAPT